MSPPFPSLPLSSTPLADEKDHWLHAGAATGGDDGGSGHASETGRSHLPQEHGGPVLEGRRVRERRTHPISHPRTGPRHDQRGDSRRRRTCP